MSQFQTICKTSDLIDGQGRAFAVDDQRIGIFLVDGHYFAIDDRCPHAGASLACGSLEGDVVRCRIHHWGFSIRDGRYVDEDKPSFNARTFETRVVGDDVQVCLR